MDYNNIREFCGNDLTGIYRVESHGDWPASSFDIDRAQPDQIFYFPPLLSFSDSHGGSTERSNLRIFEERFKDVPGWRNKKYPQDGESIMIDIFCDHQGIIATLCALADYPIISDDDHSKIQIELESEAWDTWLSRELLRRIEKHTGKYLEISDDDTFFVLYRSMVEKSNTDTAFENGNFQVNIDRLLSVLEDVDYTTCLTEY